MNNAHIAIKLAKTNKETAKAYGNFANYLADQKQDYAEAEAMFRRAIEADPNHAHTLSNFSNFLYQQKQVYTEAEAMYRRAIEADPNHANTLNNFANFLYQQKQDYAEAEAMYRRAIEADPNHANNLRNFALFLQNQKQDYAEAEVMYRRAIEADPNHPNHPNTLGNYSTLLFVKGEHKQANHLLEQAEEQPDLVPDLQIELAFYRYAHCMPYDAQPVIKLLMDNARSPDWNLQNNVERAIKDKHPQPELLAAIAKVISGDEAIESLLGFADFNDADPAYG